MSTQAAIHALVALSLSSAPLLAHSGDAALGPCSHGEFQARTAFERRADFCSDAVPQIQEHLAAVIAELEARDVDGMSPELCERRRTHIARLADYAAAGSFPQNTLQPSPTPVFIDEGGTACAVGHLMIESGGRDLAERIARMQNMAYVPEIEVAGVTDWVRSSGLTLAECALIQPTYGPCGSLNSPPFSVTCNPAVPNSLTQGLTSTAGAELVPCGSNVTTDNQFLLFVTRLPVGTTAYFLNASDGGFVANPAGSQGNLCLGGNIGRYSSDVFVSVASPTNWVGGAGLLMVDLLQTPTPLGPVAINAGETWYFQCWYRDVNPDPTSNFSDAISVTFQ